MQIPPPSFIAEIIPVKYGIAVCAPEWEVDEKQGRATHRLYYVYRGDVTYVDSESHIRLNKDTLYIFPTNVPYTITHNPHDPLCCLWIVFDSRPDFFNKTIEYQINHGSLEYFIIKSIEQFVKDQRTGSRFTALQLQQLFFFISERVEFSFILDRRIMDTLTYVNRNLDKEISVYDMARARNLDASYFSRLFKKVIGYSPQHYILDTKINRATDLLIQGYSVKESAFKVGFTDQKEFSRIFKKYKGIPPSQFKKFQQDLP
ncbi:MAG: helix-turn-helix domain-containing protein [Chitinivibrionales bacterium]|nr:helix-turn-helix domain-containing protein [Chitinivibrionales bacterium]